MATVLLQNYDRHSPVMFDQDSIIYKDTLLRDVQWITRKLEGEHSQASSKAEVLISCRDRYSFLVALLSVWAAGYAAALPPNLQPCTLQTFSKQPTIVTHLHDGLSSYGIHMATALQHVPSTTTSPPFNFLTINDHRHLVTVYTSGSTGASQAYTKTAQQLFGEAHTLIQLFSIRPKQRILATVPPFHIYGLLFSVLIPLSAGASIARPSPLHAQTVATTLDQLKIHTLVSVPAHLRNLCMLEKHELPSNLQIFCSGSMLDDSLAQAIRDQFSIAVTEVYGSTETGGIAWRHHHQSHSPWTPLPGVQIAANEDGRLLLHSPFLPAPTNDEPHNSPLLFSDQIHRISAQQFTLLGRSDDVVKVGARRVSLTQLEQRLLSFPYIKDAVVAALPSKSIRGTELAAAVVIDPASIHFSAKTLSSHKTTVRDLRRQLQQWFDPVVIPRKIRVLSHLPREANGKISRKQLHQLFSHTN